MIQEDDKLINMIQSSTRGLLASFRTKTAINYLIKGREKIADAAAKVTYKDLLDRIGAQKDRLAKLVNDFTKFNERYSLFSESKKDDDEDDHHSNDYNAALSISLKPIVKTYWDRVFYASMKLATTMIILLMLA